MRHRVELQKATESRDATGGTTRVWSTIVTRWASMSNKRGSEKFEAEQMEARTITTFRIRFHSGIDTTWRLRHTRDGKIYNIEEILDVGERKYALDLRCVQLEGSKDGA